MLRSLSIDVRFPFSVALLACEHVNLSRSFCWGFWFSLPYSWFLCVLAGSPLLSWMGFPQIITLDMVVHRFAFSGIMVTAIILRNYERVQCSMTLSSTLYMRFYVTRWSPTDFLFVFAYIWDMLLADFKLECLICSFLSFLQCEIIVCLSFVERWDRFFFPVSQTWQLVLCLHNPRWIKHDIPLAT